MCNAALREIKDAEERGQLGCGERLCPVGGRSWDTQTHIHTRGGLTLPGSAVSQLRVAMDEHTLTQSWALGRKREKSLAEERFLPRLLCSIPPDEAPHTLPVGNIPIRQCFRSIYKSNTRDRMRDEEAEQQTTELEGRETCPFLTHT